jgi:hypothetical protein
MVILQPTVSRLVWPSSRPPSGVRDKIFLSLSWKFCLDYRVLFFRMGCPFCREDGSATYSCYWTSPAQAFSVRSPTELMIISYILSFETPSACHRTVLNNVWSSLHDKKCNHEK